MLEKLKSFSERLIILYVWAVIIGCIWIYVEDGWTGREAAKYGTIAIFATFVPCYAFNLFGTADEEKDEEDVQ